LRAALPFRPTAFFDFRADDCFAAFFAALADDARADFALFLSGRLTVPFAGGAPSAVKAALAASAAVFATSRKVSANLSMIDFSFSIVPPATRRDE